MREQNPLDDKKVEKYTKEWVDVCVLLLWQIWLILRKVSLKLMRFLLSTMLYGFTHQIQPEIETLNIIYILFKADPTIVGRTYIFCLWTFSFFHPSFTLSVKIQRRPVKNASYQWLGPGVARKIHSEISSIAPLSLQWVKKC